MGILRSALGYLGLGGEDDPHASLGIPSAPRLSPRRGDGAGGVGPGLVMKGEVAGEGDFDILGKFEGEINVVGRVFVGEGAHVDANINAASIVIGGTVRGNLSAATRVEILPTGVLTGTLKTGSFAAADGASVKGEMWIERGGLSGRSQSAGEP
jgi:cytoskeletal protein CcmA (bactofilin family)